MKLAAFFKKRDAEPMDIPPASKDFHSPEELKKRERKRRRLEMVAIALLVLLVAVGTWGQLSYFESNSWIFVALLNVNGLLMLVVLFLVARNVVKLVLERRRKVFGSRLRTRLVLAFVSLSLVPIVLMFLAANRVVATSVDYWFTSQVENSMQAALDVGRSFYNVAANRLRNNGLLLLEQLNFSKLEMGSPSMEEAMIQWQKEFGLVQVGFVTRISSTPPTFIQQHWQNQPSFNNIWSQVQGSIDWNQVEKVGHDSMMWGDPVGDFAISIILADSSRFLYLVSVESIGRGLIKQMEKISKGFDEYTTIKSFKHPLKLSFTMILGLLGLIIICGAIWVGFRISRQLVEPILALSRGTAQVAQGVSGLHIEDKGKDELGQLVESFNRMAQDIQESREDMTRLNSLLGHRSQVLFQRNRYIETVLEHIAAGVVTLDQQGRILTMNKAACRIFGTNAHLWQGRMAEEILSPEHGQILKLMWQSLKKHPDRAWQHEVDIVRKDRLWKLLIHAVALPAPRQNTDPMLGEDMAYEVDATLPSADDMGMDSEQATIGSVVAVLEDITELARAQKLAAWREVARRIAHEIKNPLTPIKLSAQRLERKFSAQVSDPVFAQCTRLIVKEVERMQGMVQEFSSFATLSDITLRPTSLVPVVEELISLFQTSHPRIRWVSYMDPNLPTIPLDAEAMHRALFNILSNAVEALEGKSDPQVEVMVEYKAENLILEVRDNGPGLGQEEISRLFEPYFSRKSGGTGLGLAIVRSVVNTHGGKVSAGNVPGGGTYIRTEFPVESFV